jgi:hypothetical protein
MCKKESKKESKRDLIAKNKRNQYSPETTETNIRRIDICTGKPIFAGLIFVLENQYSPDSGVHKKSKTTTQSCQGCCALRVEAWMKSTRRRLGAGA